MTIFYEFGGKLYANITNKCPCACVFCIRKNGDSVGGNDSLWLSHEPDIEEIISAYEAFDKTGLSDLVFCGYGEPMTRADILIEFAKYVKEHTDMTIRVNTNGLVPLIDPDFDTEKMRGVIDSVSISLNAPDKESYLEVTKPKFGIDSFDVMLQFAKKMKDVVGDVAFTVVDVISEEQISACQELSDNLGIPLRVRHNVTNNESYT